MPTSVALRQSARSLLPRPAEHQHFDQCGPGGPARHPLDSPGTPYVWKNVFWEGSLGVAIHNGWTDADIVARTISVRSVATRCFANRYRSAWTSRKIGVSWERSSISITSGFAVITICSQISVCALGIDFLSKRDRWRRPIAQMVATMMTATNCVHAPKRLSDFAQDFILPDRSITRERCRATHHCGSPFSRPADSGGRSDKRCEYVGI